MLFLFVIHYDLHAFCGDTYLPHVESMYIQQRAVK
jgi:hypothetical protein